MEGNEIGRIKFKDYKRMKLSSKESSEKIKAEINAIVQ